MSPRRAECVQAQAKVMIDEGHKQLTTAIEATKAAVDATAGPPVVAPLRETEMANEPQTASKEA